MRQSSFILVLLYLAIGVFVSSCSNGPPITLTLKTPLPGASTLIAPSSSATPGETPWVSPGSICQANCTGEGTSATPLLPSATQISKNWFGMQINPDVWQLIETENSLYQHGLLTHRSLTGCRVWLLSEDPVYIGGYKPDWGISNHDEFKTAEITVNLWRIKDQTGNLKDIYFEVYDTTGQRGYDLYRLAYFLVDTGEKPVQCLETIYSVIKTITPKLFPKLDVAQG
jgi:hypothetical protein